MGDFPIKRWMTAALLFCNFYSFSQNTFRNYLSDADDSSRQQLFTAAIKLLHKAKALQGHDTGYNGSVNQYLGYNYESINKVDSAIIYYAEALPYYESINNIESLNFLYNHLGCLEVEFSGRYDKALTYFTKQLPCTRSQRDSTKIFDCLNNIGIVHKFLNNQDSAIFYFRQVATNNSTYNLSKNSALRFIADTYSSKGQFEMALLFYDKAIQGLILEKDSSSLFMAYINKGDCLMRQNKFVESLVCFKNAEKSITAIVADNDKKVLYHNFAYVYGKTGDLRRALHFKSLESDIKDSINTQNIQKVATESEAKYETQKNKDNLIISQQTVLLKTNESNDRERKFIITLISAAIVFLIAFLALRNATLRKKANTKLASQKAKLEALAADLEEANQTKARLFSVISHDLRSPVSSLYASLKMQELKGGNDVANTVVSDQIMHLLDTLEDLLTWSKSQMDRFILQPVTLRVTDLYTDLIELHEDAAAGKQITVENKADRQVKIYTDENLLKTIIRNVLANSINHAPNKSTVVMNAQAYDNGVICTISNEATATDAATLEARLQTAAIGSSKHGLGNVLIKEFTQKLNADFEVTYRDGKVYVQIKLPSMQKQVKALQPVVT